MTDVKHPAVIGRLALAKLKAFGVYDAAQAAFQEVSDAIDARAATANPKKKVYEVHHEVVVSRDAFLKSVLDPANTAENVVQVGKVAAFEAIKLVQTQGAAA